MAPSQNYPGNRARYKKVYGRVAVQPNYQTFIDPVTNGTKTLDFNLINKEYNMYIIPGSSSVEYTPPPPADSAEWDDACMFVDNLTGTTITFSAPFSSLPYVTLYLENPEVLVNPFIVNNGITTNTCEVGFSGIYRGWLCWRAIYSPTYPTTVLSTYQVSAGKETYNNEFSRNINYSAFTTEPKMFGSPEDTANNSMADVFVSSGTIGLANTTVYVSSLLSGSVNWITIENSYPT